jgi:hypothetical protein
MGVTLTLLAGDSHAVCCAEECPPVPAIRRVVLGLEQRPMDESRYGRA